MEFVLEKLTSIDSEKHMDFSGIPLKAVCYEDNALQMEALCNGLSYWGIQCIPVTRLEDVSQALKAHQDADMAFIQVHEGTEEQITHILQHQKVPGILISKRAIRDPQLLGAQNCLYKPISIQKLHDAINHLLDSNEKITPIHYELTSLRTQLQLTNSEILIAEDNPVNLMLLQSLLGPYAHIDTATNGKEATKLAQIRRYDLILLDLQMPKMNGLEAAKLIHQESKLNQQTPILLISANHTQLNKNQLKQTGIALCLQKPIDEKQLLHTMLSLLQKRKTVAINWSVCIEKMSDNKALALEYMTRFVEELEKNRKEFAQLFAKKNSQGIQNAAHKLYGACCFCSVPLLQKQVLVVEKQAKAQPANVDDLKPAVTLLIKRIEEVIEAFHDYAETSVVA